MGCEFSWPLPSNHFILGRLKSPVNMIFGRSVACCVILFQDSVSCNKGLVDRSGGR